jgi:hypothetical protein
MHPRIITAGMALAFVGGLAGCSPGPGGYAEWSDYRQHQANDDAYLSRQNATAAQWQVQSGDYQGDAQSHPWQCPPHRPRVTH